MNWFLRKICFVCFTNLFLFPLPLSPSSLVTDFPIQLFFFFFLRFHVLVISSVFFSFSLCLISLSTMFSRSSTLQMIGFPSFFFLMRNNTPLCICTLFSLSVHLSVVAWVVFSIMSNSAMNRCLFKVILFPLCIY